MNKKNKNPFSEFESLPAHMANGLSIRPFRFLKDNSDQNSDQFLSRVNITYKVPKLRKGKRRWWVEYWFRVPAKLQHLYGNRQWEKFRVFEDINRVKTDEYAKALVRSIELSLKDGFDPFVYQEQALEVAKSKIDPKKQWTSIQALYYFLQTWQGRGNEDSTTAKYKRSVELMTEWLIKHKIQNEPATTITKKYVELCLQDNYIALHWSNRTYNNNLDFLTTVFIFLRDEKIIIDNPCKGITAKRSKSKKHRYYDPDRFDLVRKLMKEYDPVLFFAASLVYYLCIRSEKELRHFKIDNIFPDRKQVLIQAEESKTDADRFIPIPDELLPELTDLKNKYPGNYYVIGVAHRNKFIPDNLPGPDPFGRNFLSARFAKIRKLAKFSQDYTLYGMKHTRIIHLKRDGGKDPDIMKLTGHTSYQAYSDYLRDLGIDGDADAINKISRKF